MTPELAAVSSIVAASSVTSESFHLSTKDFAIPHHKGALDFTWRHSLGRGAVLLA